MARLTLKEMAEQLRMSPKTFAADVRRKNIPYIPVGKGNRKRFDPVAVEAHLASLVIPDASKVVKFRPSVAKSRDKKSRFAEAVGV